MINRCIMLFPKFKNEEIINKIREKYDPLAQHVKPHITLVFPFHSTIKKEELEGHITEAISELKPFEMALHGITPSDSFGKYLFLNIHQGKKNIVEIHNKLYTGILEKYYPQWLKGEKFFPHMTVGNFQDEQEFKKAIDPTRDIEEVFKTVISEVYVEVIDENEDSIIEICVPLK